jgi:hypothetical protein
MKQILHIFAKDTRRFWPEILIVLSLVVTYVSIDSYLFAFNSQFRSSGIEAGGKLPKLLPLLIAFIHFAWILLVCRVIHAERLVGDTQFWITRPYEWKKLIAAKLLFVVAFVYLPVLAGFFILRAESGTPLHAGVATNILGGIGDVFSYITVLVLSAAAIATVTSNIARMMGGILFACIIMTIVSVIPLEMRPDSVPGHLSVGVCFALFYLLCSAAILLQYARRKTRLSVALLIAIPVLICAIHLFTPERRPPDRIHPSQTTANRPA